MNTQVEIAFLLRREFAQIRERNPAFSLRAFAAKLQIAPSTLSEIFSGKKSIALRSGRKILDRLSIESEKRHALLEALAGKAKISQAPVDLVQVAMDQYHLISDWYYFAILSLSETETFRGSPEWVAKRLNIRTSVARNALKRLERLGLLARSGQGNLVPTGKAFKTTSDIPNSEIRRSHLQNLELARLSLENDSLDLCDPTAMTMAIDPAKIPEAKKRIRRFRRDLCRFLESGRKLEVFRMYFHLFPMSRGKLCD
jgi:uncharacterized protein (TIGR02147 family)